jgi:hypothetical protein
MALLREGNQARRGDKVKKCKIYVKNGVDNIKKA